MWCNLPWPLVINHDFFVLLNYGPCLPMAGMAHSNREKKSWQDWICHPFYRSHIKTWIWNKTDGKVDINNEAIFKSFNNFYSGFIKKLKRAGKADTRHNPEIPAHTQRTLHILFGHLQGVLNARDCHEYEQMLQNLPEKCRDNYHDLLQKAVMYIVIMFDCRRGLEGLAAMERNFFCKKWDENTQKFRYEKTQGEASKNHQSDSEDLENSGIILFDTDQYGYNPGELMEFYLSKLHPDNSALFQQPRLISKKRFNLHTASTTW